MIKDPPFSYCARPRLHWQASGNRPYTRSGQFASVTGSIGSGVQQHVENDVELLPVPYSFSLSAEGSAEGATATTNGTCNFFNDLTQAVFSGSHTFTNQGSPQGQSSSAVAFTLIDFTLTERANYSFTGSLPANNNSGSTSEILGQLTDLSPSGGQIYRDTKTGATTSVLLEHFPNGLAGTNTGTLSAGMTGSYSASKYGMDSEDRAPEDSTSP